MTIGETTSATQHLPRGGHLVGSVPLGDAEAVFRAATSILDGRFRRCMPHGETLFTCPAVPEVPRHDRARAMPIGVSQSVESMQSHTCGEE